MKSAKTVVIVAAVLFAALSLSAPSAERDETTPALVTPTRTPTRPATISEEETPIPRPAARPVRVTKPRTPSRRTPNRPDIVRRIPPIDPHKNSVIMLEAFMVEVRLSALHSLGAPAISKGDDFISADHIIKLMKTTDAAVVTAGAKLAMAQANKAKTESTTRKGLYMDPPNNTRTEYIDVGTSFTAIAEIRQEKIFAELEFEYSDAVKNDENDHAIPQIIERSWGSTICLSPGEPTLVGATQEKKMGAFLIVTANIKQ